VGQYLTFSLDREMYGVSVFHVKEVLEVPSITKIPGMPGFMRGVINIRGSVVPVVDIKNEFEMGNTELNKETSIIVVEITLDDSINLMGILVDAVHEVIQLEEEYIEPPPKIGMKLESSYIEGMGKKNDKFIILLKVQEILTSEKLASVNKNFAANNSDSLEEAILS